MNPIGLKRWPKSINVKIVLSEQNKPRISERLHCDDDIVKESLKDIT